MKVAARCRGVRCGIGLLAGLVWFGFALLLLTPFIVSEGTIFPYVVGRAVHARIVVAVLVAAWALLAACDPRYRLRATPMTLAIGAWVGTGLLTSATGADPLRSLWSSYERMGGVVDRAHWAAAALVLAAMVQRPRTWRIIFALLAVTGLLCAWTAIAQSQAAAAGGQSLPRAAAPFGNPLHLANYLQGTVIVIAGLTLYALRDRTGARWRKGLTVTLCLVAAVVCLWALTLTGSLGPLFGVGAGLATLAWLSLRRSVQATRRIVLWTGTGVVSAVLVGSAAVVAVQRTGTLPEFLASNAVIERITRPDPLLSLRQREAAWTAGARAWRERPWTGWGPENFRHVWERFGVQADRHGDGFDDAHNAVIEVMATEGMAGLAAGSILLVFAFRAAGRSARDGDAASAGAGAVSGAVLAGHCAAALTGIADAGASLQLMLALACLTSCEQPCTSAPARSRAATRFALVACVFTVSGVAATSSVRTFEAAELLKGAVLAAEVGEVPRTVVTTLLMLSAERAPWLAHEPRRYLGIHAGAMR